MRALFLAESLSPYQRVLQIIALLGVSLWVTRDPDEALALIATTKFNLLVVGVDWLGSEVLEIFATDKSALDLPVLCATHDDALGRWLRRIGADESVSEADDPLLVYERVSRMLFDSGGR